MINLNQSIILASSVLTLGLGALLILLLEVSIKRDWNRELLAVLLCLVCLASSWAYSDLYVRGQTGFSGLVYLDPVYLYTVFFTVVGTILVILLSRDVLETEGVEDKGEYYALLLLATAGAIIFSSAAELLTLFIGLETMSIALYALSSSARHNKYSSEAGLKYFILGSFASAFLLFGISLLYGFTGTMFMSEIAEKISVIPNEILFVSLAFVLVGLCFKLGVVPFHFWVPDVYEGSPSCVTPYMASVVKASAVVALLRIIWGVFGTFMGGWESLVFYLSILTILTGNLISICQTSVKRMLAYSSIAHAGYILIGFIAYRSDDFFRGGEAILFYLVAYGIATIGAFGVNLAVNSSYSGKKEADHISHFNGLGLRSPFLGASMSLFMFSLAGLGIPLAMAGFLGKVYIFYGAIQANYTSLALVGAVGSLISCYYYLRVIVAMYFTEETETRLDQVNSRSLNFTILVCGIFVFLLGLFPSLILRAISLIV